MANSVGPPQRDRTTANAAWNSVSYLVAGIVLYGGIGWLLSLWFGHRAMFIAGGVVIGVGLSLYLVHVRTSQMAADGDASGGKSP